MGSVEPYDQVCATVLPSDEQLQRAKRLFPKVLEDEVREDSQRVVAMIAKSSDISLGFDSLTTGQLLHAVDFTAHWINSQIGISSSTETIAYVGTQDFRYPIMEIAAMKTGNPLLIPSPRNALANTISLLEATNCSKLFYASHLSELAASLGHTTPGLQTYEVPSMEEMLNGTAQPYPYHKTWEENKDEIALIAHTSGSTGAPKPKRCSHAFLSSFIYNTALMPGVPGRTSGGFNLLERGGLLLSGSSFFHMSMIMFAFSAIILGSTLVSGPPDVPSSGKMMHDIMKVLPIHGLINAPSITEQLFLENSEGLEAEIAALKHISWLGGPLSQKAADFIVNHTKAILWQIFGSTECGIFPVLVPPPSHSSYIEFHPHYSPDLQPIAPGSPLYEVVVNKWSNPALSWAQPVFHLAPDVTQWRTRDLLRRCEDPLPDGVGPLWKFESRIDDIIILSNAHKVNPVHIETLLQSHPLLNGCLIFGENRRQCGILLEQKEGLDMADQDLVREVWPDIEKANATVPEHARIERGLVLVVKEDRKFVRAAKGTIVRSQSRRAYQSEIDTIYEHFEAAIC